jgi:hypothetical protein
MKQEIPLTDAELRRLAARIRAGTESPDVIDLLTEQEASRLEAVTSDLPKPPSEPSVMDSWQTKVARGSRMLPAVGGAVGGVLGAASGLGTAGTTSIPGALGGAAAGGAVGNLLSQGIRTLVGRDAPETLGQAGTELLEESAFQVPMEMGGRALMGGAKVLGRGLYDAALRPTGTLLQEFPDVVTQALKARMPVGDVIPGVTQKGSQMARQARQASSQATARLLDNAGTKGGVRFGMADVIEKPIQSLTERIQNQPETRADLAALGKFVRELLEDKAGDITPIRLKAIKQSAQAVAQPIYKAQQKGMPVTAAQSLSAQMNASVAEGAKASLETIGGVGESEALTKSLIGVTRAIRQAEARRAPLTTHVLAGVAGAGGVGGGVAAGGGSTDDATLGLTLYLLTRMAASPRTMSRAGIQLSRAGVQEVLRLLPYAAEGMYAATRERGGPVRPPGQELP